jgi:hypothetical protein
VVEHSPHYPKAEGSSLAAATGTGRENMAKKGFIKFVHGRKKIKSVFSNFIDSSIDKKDRLSSEL